VQYTVLELVQSILASMGSDEVNSIGDTAEAQQVLNIVETVYYNIAARGQLPEHEGLIQLTSVNDPLRPTLMQVPSNVTRIDWINYFDTNPADGSSIQDDQFGAYSPHDTNVDLQNNSTFAASYPWTATSTSSVTVGTGIQTFQTTQGMTIGLGNQCEILVGTTLYMSGVVTAYYSVPNQTYANLVVNVTATSGSGTYSSWTINQLNAPTTAPGYCNVCILPASSFLYMTNTFNTQDSDVLTYNFTDSGSGSTFLVNYKNDFTPHYCCFIGNQYVLFDTFDATQDACLQASKTQCWGQFIPAFIPEDNFIPLLNDYQFPLLLAECKSLAFLELKQMVNTKAEQETRRQWSNLQKNKSVVNKPSYFDQLPNFGRRPYWVSYGPNPVFRNSQAYWGGTQ
jgi:hypothetical protein